MKTINLDTELDAQIKALCDVLHTNFTSKVKELLVNWKIDELNRLKDRAPELHAAYLLAIGNPPFNASNTPMPTPVKASVKSTHKKAINRRTKP